MPVLFSLQLIVKESKVISFILNYGFWSYPYRQQSGTINYFFDRIKETKSTELVHTGQLEQSKKEDVLSLKTND